MQRLFQAVLPVVIVAPQVPQVRCLSIGCHPMLDKRETYRVEGDNAECRHYLVRLTRRSRCFSCCIQALRRAVKLFVYLWNRRQLHRQH